MFIITEMLAKELMNEAKVVYTKKNEKDVKIAFAFASSFLFKLYMKKVDGELKLKSYEHCSFDELIFELYVLNHDTYGKNIIVRYQSILDDIKRLGLDDIITSKYITKKIESFNANVLILKSIYQE